MNRFKLIPIEYEHQDRECDEDSMTFFNPTFYETWGTFEKGLKCTMLTFCQKTGVVFVHVKGQPMVEISVKLEMK